MLWNQVNQTVELGWDFYLPVILFVALIGLAVPVWAAIGVADSVYGLSLFLVVGLVEVIQIMIGRRAGQSRRGHLGHLLGFARNHRGHIR